MNSFEELLKRFDAVLRDKNLPNYGKLKDPLPADETDDLFKKLDLGGHPDLRLFYAWKDGYDYNGTTHTRCQIVDYDFPLTLKSIDDYGQDEQVDFWAPSFIPLFTDMTGQYLLLNNNQKDADYGKLHLFSPSMFFTDEPISYYDSIGSMIESAIMAYEQDLFHYEAGDDWLEVDEEGYARIAAKMNPHSKYWTI